MVLSTIAMYSASYRSAIANKTASFDVNLVSKKNVPGHPKETSFKDTVNFSAKKGVLVYVDLHEVSKDKHGNFYSGIPENSESGFGQLLDENYECIAKG